MAALAAQRLIAWRGARVVLWLAAALAASGALLVALSWSASTLALGVLIAGSAAGAASPAMVVAVASTVRETLVARAQAVVNAGTGVGVAVAGAATLAAPQAWRPVWVCAAAVALLAAATVDRRTHWPTHRRGTGAGERHAQAVPCMTLLRPIVAAAVAGTGSAAVWTFGRDLITDTGGLPERTTAALWALLGTAAVLGALSGDAVRLLGIRGAWALTATLTATGTAILALAPGQVVTAAIAGAVFGGAYTALSGVLIAWASVLRPTAAGQATATLFIALTAGQAVGAIAAGVVAERAGARAAFWACAVLLLAAATVLPARTSSGATVTGSPRRRGHDVIPVEHGEPSRTGGAVQSRQRLT